MFGSIRYLIWLIILIYLGYNTNEKTTAIIIISLAIFLTMVVNIGI